MENNDCDDNNDDNDDNNDNNCYNEDNDNDFKKNLFLFFPPLKFE